MKPIHARVGVAFGTIAVAALALSCFATPDAWCDEKCGDERGAESRSVAALAKILLSEGAQAVAGKLVVSVPGASIEVPTASGEPADAVAARVAAVVNQSPDFRALNVSATRSGSALFFTSPRVYVCSDSDIDLGVPPKPRAVQCIWNGTSRTLTFLWENPRHYDIVEIVDSAGIRVNSPRLDGGSTRYEHRFDQRSWSTRSPGRNTFGVVGVIGATQCMTTCEVEL